MATIAEDYVSFEIAKLLKEKGFPQQEMEFTVTTRDCSFIVNGNQKVEECAGTKLPYYPYSKLFLYEEDWAVLPTPSMAMKWLREVHSLHIWIGHAAGKVLSWYYEIHGISDGKVKHIGGIRCGSYEVACEAAIKYCLENLI